MAALRRAGAFVEPLHGVGGGCPDLLVGFRGVWSVIEVKDGAKVPSARKLTPDEAEWHAMASLHAPVHVATDLVSALRAIGAIS